MDVVLIIVLDSISKIVGKNIIKNCRRYTSRISELAACERRVLYLKWRVA